MSTTATGGVPTTSSRSHDEQARPQAPRP